MLPLIQRNAARLRELHQKIHDTFALRARSDAHRAEWEEATRQFHAEYNALAFPGGLEEGLEKIKTGDVPTIEVALQYLENPPYCFRSQYVADGLKRAINKVVLPELLASRFADWKEKRSAEKSRRRGGPRR